MDRHLGVVPSTQIYVVFARCKLYCRSQLSLCRFNRVVFHNRLPDMHLMWNARLKTTAGRFVTVTWQEPNVMYVPLSRASRTRLAARLAFASRICSWPKVDHIQICFKAVHPQTAISPRAAAPGQHSTLCASCHRAMSQLVPCPCSSVPQACSRVLKY